LHPSLRALIEDQLWKGLPAFTGAQVGGTLPVTEQLVGEVLAALASSGRRGIVQLHSVTILPGDRLRLELSVRALFLVKRIGPEIQLLEFAGLPERPYLAAVLPVQYVVLLSRLLRQQIDPDGSLLSFDGRTVTIWVDVLVRREWGDAGVHLLRLLKSLSFHTEQGTLFLEFGCSSARSRRHRCARPATGSSSARSTTTEG
jgi:hypothetical protein